MMSLSTKLTLEEYLAIERRAEFRSKFRDGEMVARARLGWPHTLIKDQFARAIRSRLNDDSCDVLTSSLRVCVIRTRQVVYPDILICDKPEFVDNLQDTLLNPQVVVEVLSDSTESDDRGTKFKHYRQIDSLKEYILVAQDRPTVERFVRQPSGDWLLTEFSGIDQVVALGTLNVQVPMSEIYQDIEFSEVPLR